MLGSSLRCHAQTAAVGSKTIDILHRSGVEDLWGVLQSQAMFSYPFLVVAGLSSTDETRMLYSVIGKKEPNDVLGTQKHLCALGPKGKVNPWSL